MQKVWSVYKVVKDLTVFRSPVHCLSGVDLIFMIHDGCWSSAITGFRKEEVREKGCIFPLQSLSQRPRYTWADLSMGRTGHMVTFLPQAKRGDAIFKLDISVPSWKNGEFFFYSLPADCGVEDRLKRSKEPLGGGPGTARKRQGVAWTQGCPGGDGEKWIWGWRWVT